MNVMPKDSALGIPSSLPPATSPLKKVPPLLLSSLNQTDPVSSPKLAVITSLDQTPYTGSVSPRQLHPLPISKIAKAQNIIEEGFKNEMHKKLLLPWLGMLAQQYLKPLQQMVTPPTTPRTQETTTPPTTPRRYHYPYESPRPKIEDFAAIKSPSNRRPSLSSTQPFLPITQEQKKENHTT